MSLSLFGIILGLVLLMFLAYKGYSIIWVAPVCAVVVAVLSGYAILDAYIGDYMKGMADYVLQWFPAFFLGAVYGKVMDLTGSARSLGNALVKLIGPRFAVAAVVIPCLLMTYGGTGLVAAILILCSPEVTILVARRRMIFSSFRTSTSLLSYSSGTR